MIQFIQADLQAIASLRCEYIGTLPEFQELYLELLIESADVFLFEDSGSTIGYAAKTKDNILVELYLRDIYIPSCHELFNEFLQLHTVSKIYCKTFDFLLLNCCLGKTMKYRLIGSLFREFHYTEPLPYQECQISYAGMHDYSFLLQQEGGLYETPQELEKFVKGNNILMFYKNSQLMGCGFLIRVHEKWNYYDIGMWVHPDFRKQGMATLIISYLKNLCIENQWTPICGCAIDNVASQRTLEKNGFISKHKLIEFS